MIKRNHQILAGVLIAQIVLSVVVFWPRPSTAAQAEPLFPDLEVGDVTTLTVEDAQGNGVTLQRVAGEWTLPEADEYPARSDDIDSFVKKLTELSTGRLVTGSDTSHRRLQVAPDEFARRILFGTSGGTRHTVYLGTSPQYGSAHFRVEGQSETYLTSELSAYDANATIAGWIDSSYRSAAQEDVNRFTLENASGTFVFEKEGDESWTMAGLGEDETLDQAEVRRVLQRASSITMRKPLGREEDPLYGMDDPSALVMLETDEKVVTLQVGAKEPDDAGYVVKSSESDYYVSVAESGVRALVENGRDAFLEQPPTPEEESNGA